MSLSQAIDVTEIMREIRERVRQKQANTPKQTPVDPPASPAIERVQATRAELRSAVEQIDKLPPQPATARGSIGYFASRLLRRVLFWQYTQANAVGGALVAFIDSIISVLQVLANRISEIDQMELSVRATAGKLQRLDEQCEELRATSATTTEDIRLLREHIERFSGIKALMDADLDTIRATVVDLTARVGEVEASIHASVGNMAALRAEVTATAESRNTESVRVAEQVVSLDRRLLQIRRDLLLQEQRINLLRNPRGRDVEEPAPPVTLKPNPDPMSSLYLALEDAFRGSPGDIAERVSAYIPTLESMGIRRGSDLVLDIGCGRGEWLRVLTDAGYSNQGCDVNPDMVETCREHGYSVVQQDALRFLGSFAENSVGAITAFHVVEHLPLATMLDLINESFRVLRPGGVLILETPNPQNVIVASHNFYIDPTHRKPIPMVLLQFLVEARGFSNVEGKGLHPYPEAMLLQDQSEMAMRFNEYFYGPQDYAVIATKP